MSQLHTPYQVGTSLPDTWKNKKKNKIKSKRKKKKEKKKIIKSHFTSISHMKLLPFPLPNLNLTSILLPTSMAFLLIILVLQLLSPQLILVGGAPSFLNLTAISAAHGASTLECWQLVSPFAVSATPGTVGTAILQLGNATSASYTVLPPNFDGGAHRAPAVQ